jgi:1H-pyrrole-2-carbonyl-[peptidyl-carrier protein] chlorinase
LGFQPDFDVGIIGGGPAGAAMGAYLGRAGINCVIFERELFPRPHVGESLVPSVNRLLQDLELLPVMEQFRFPHKFGAVWTSAATPRVYSHDWEGLAPVTEANVTFGDRPLSGVAQRHTYHVDRGVFDNVLLHHAHKLGAHVYEGVSVKGADFSEPDHVRVRYGFGNKDLETTVRVLADASGRRTLIGNQLKWRIKDPVFDQYALHTWFEGYDRLAFTQDKNFRDYLFVHFLPMTNTWVWQIPITDALTSIGVVTQKKHFKAGSKASREQFFWDCVGTRPELCEALRASTQVRPLKEEGDYSYAMAHLAGDRLVLLGDAGRFVDPIFATGVSIAFHSALFASQDVVGAMETGDFSRSAFGSFTANMGRGMKNWYEFITIYYRLNVLFTAFVNDPEYRLDMLKLLQGDVYDEEHPAVITRMREVVAAVEKNERHPWHKLLGDLTSNAFKEAAFRAAV